MNAESRTMITGFVDRILELRCSYQCTVDGVTVDVEEFFQLSKNHNTAWGRTSPRSGPPVGPVRLTVDGDTEHLNIIGAMVCNIEDIATQAPVLVAQDLVQAHAATAQVMYPKARAAHEAVKAIAQGFDGGSAALTEWLFDVLKTLQARMPAPRTVEEAAPAPGQSVGADKVLADLVAPMGGNGTAMASKLREPPPKDGLWGRWAATPDTLPAALLSLARVGWFDIVKPRLEHEAELKRKQQAHIRFPQTMGQAVTAGRTSSLKSRKDKARERGAEWAKHVMIEAPGMQLFLQYDGAPSGRGNTLQSLLTGGLLKTYLLTHAACADQAGMNPVDGTFVWDERGVYQKYLSDGGNVGGRNVDLMREDMQRLLKMRVVGIEGITMSQPEPLIIRWTVNRTGLEVYAHAKTITTFLRQHFSQIPRAVLKLDSRDMPLALGLATLARRDAIKLLAENGKATMTLEQLARACGEDVAAGTSSHGRAVYWKRALERLAKIASAGKIGEVVTLARGAPDASTPVGLKLDEHLASAYKPLAVKNDTMRRAAATVAAPVKARKT